MTSPSKSATSCKNHILLQLPEPDRDALLSEAARVCLPGGHTFARAGDDIVSAFFPDTGVICSVSEMRTGHQMALVAIGPEGVIGLGPLFSVFRYPHRLIVLVEADGYQISSARLNELFQRSEALRSVALTHVGRVISELTVAAGCYRFHSHRQRLARWLLVATDKAAQRSLRVTHEALAQMVGGPRHAVTVALNELRAKGAIAPLRGRVEIVNRSMLVREACECYDARGSLGA